ncbi:transcription-repair coupling factor, partial [candidate division WOR-3 bacterium]|nr:transcription-repair coupling factor [candidate division WOR-3 bacterium]
MTIKENILISVAEKIEKDCPLSVNRLSASELALVLCSLHFYHKKSIFAFLDDEKEIEKISSDIFVMSGVLPKTLPRWDKALPGEFSPSPDIVRRRMDFLLSAGRGKNGIYIAGTDSLTEKVPSPKRLESFSLKIELGSGIDTEKTALLLTNAGYNAETNAINPGEFSMRGGIIDVFSQGEEYPARIELFGDKIDDLRVYDPSNQRSVRKITTYNIIPAREILLDDEETAEFRNKFPEFPDPFALGCEAIAKELRNDDVQLESVFHNGLLFSESAEITGARKINWGDGVTTPVDFSFEDMDKEGIAGDFKNYTVRFFVKSQSLSKKLGKYFPDADFVGKPLSSGFLLECAKQIFITEKELFGIEPRLITQKEREHYFVRDEIEFLPVGTYVVHEQSGVGRYKGVKVIDHGGQKTEYLMLEYADEAILYLPVHKLHLLTRYIGPKDSAVPQLSSLGSLKWLQKKQKAKKIIWDMTIELAQHYALRKAATAPAIEIDDELARSLSSSFEFEETPDQLKAIEDVYSDLIVPKPMDRLICGEVGFGKTEVAVRASMKAANSGYQTAVLVPTTVLCRQHFDVFKRRLADYPMKIEMLSRFVSREGAKKTIENISSGKTDVVIGTHRLLSQDIKFRNLGLLIIDEEHKFGVKQKEKLRKLKKNVNTLMMSATPIPRTLHMSLWNLMDVSQIRTAPPGRFPIETSVIPFSEKVVKDAVYFEISRGGQVFFLHNRIDSLQAVEAYLRRILPDVSMKCCHGRMSSGQIEKIMVEFYDHEFDVLISTTIIESGLDIRNANTLIVDRADTLGLAQLHQIRGRIGRGDVRAYCYFMIPRKGPKTDSGKERLKAIRSYARLGAGYQLAMHDMKIRGAGNLLGSQQSGYDFDIGYELYMKYLEEAVEKIKAEKGEQEEIEHDVLTDFAYYIPPEFVQDAQERVYLYRRIAGSSLDELSDIEAEIKDRYGALPENAIRFFEVAKLYRTVKESCIASLTLTESLKIQFAKDPERWYIEKLVLNMPE